MRMKLLYLIPARGNSKGLPGKNIRVLNDKPLIEHSIAFAKAAYMPGRDVICVSTDSTSIAQIAKEADVQIPFIRPAELASDTAGTYDVIKHAINHYEETEGLIFDAVVLLQPTSPFRNLNHIKEMLGLAENNTTADMIVSVKKSKDNPYFTLFEETVDGYLSKSKPGDFLRRQDCPEVYAYNGSIYIMRVSALKKSPIHRFEKVIKYVMEDDYSVDIDTQRDWVLAEYLLQQRKDLLQFEK